MPLTRVEIEQTAPDRWVAEVEQGGITAQRTHVREETPQALLAAIAVTMGVGKEVVNCLRGTQPVQEQLAAETLQKEDPALVPRSANERGPKAAQVAQTAVATGDPSPAAA